MKKAEKQQVIDALKSSFDNGNYFYFADASGMTVEQINKLRRKCFDKGIKLQVAKNTFVRKALESSGKYSDEIEKALSGPTAIFFSEVGNAPAKLIAEFRGKTEKPVLKGAYIDSAIFIGDNQLEALKSLKSKDELLGELIGLLQSPAKNVISALKSGGNTIAGLVKALEERAA
ncbi:MAG TPA: 50S ribosomal protein L10 [Bacteroidia bacterium]|nr:50S ribosomal protein L10 [Bacteroidia bacterium]